jgi:hypothetical protein
VGKRVWATLTRQLKGVIADAFDEACTRDPERQKRWFVLVDGDRKLTRWVREEARRRQVKNALVLDFIHALEVPLAGCTCFLQEGKPRTGGLCPGTIGAGTADYRPPTGPKARQGWNQISPRWSQARNEPGATPGIPGDFPCPARAVLYLQTIVEGYIVRSGHPVGVGGGVPAYPGFRNARSSRRCTPG